MATSVRNVAAFCVIALLAGSSSAQGWRASYPPKYADSVAIRSGSDFRPMSARQQAELLPLVDRSPFGISLTLQQMGIPASVYHAWKQQGRVMPTEFVEGQGAKDQVAEDQVAEDGRSGGPIVEFVLPEVSEAGPPVGFFETCRPSWVITQEAVLLKRSTADAQDLLFAPTPILNATDLTFNFEGGPRIGLIHGLDGGFALELNYFGIDAWSSSAVRTGNGLSPLVIFPPGAIVSDQFRVEYGSEFYSAEANFRYQWGEDLDLLAGFRYAELQDDFGVVGQIVAPWTAVPSYATHAANYLYGIQIGATARVFDRGPLLCVDGFFKSGLFVNHARQVTTTVHNTGTLRSVGDRKDNAAFLGEIGLTGVCQLGNHWAVRGGYQVMFVEGVALAPDQIPHTNFPILPVPGADARLHTGSSLFYHGFHVGLEARW